MKVAITYCTKWNYGPRASRLEEELVKGFAAEVELIPGSGGVFEVVCDGRKIFSKASLGRFPAEGEIASLIEAGR